jgi:hypothetical protein
MRLRNERFAGSPELEPVVDRTLADVVQLSDLPPTQFASIARRDYAFPKIQGVRARHGATLQSGGIVIQH